MSVKQKFALTFDIKACFQFMRTSILTLKHGKCRTPMFMPVGTQAAIKGLTSQQLKQLDVDLMLCNTYFMNLRPGPDVVSHLGGLHGLMNWDGCILTDSGGFQMVSLLDLSEITEEGVKFKSPIDGQITLLTPEESIQIQNKLGADIIMALDDVVPSTLTGPRVIEAQERTIRWLDRCYSAHTRPLEQNLFAIVQGALDLDLRRKCVEEFIKRDDHIPGYAIGGLSGGEEKDQFWRVVHACAQMLPPNKPRYCMGVGYPVDVIICSVLGVDMFDCVYPCRTARFGTALADVPGGVVQLRSNLFNHDVGPIDKNCDCFVCKGFSRARLHQVAGRDTGNELITYHNIAYMMNLTRRFRTALLDTSVVSSTVTTVERSSSSSNDSPTFVKVSNPIVSFVVFFMRTIFPRKIDVPEWVQNSLLAGHVCDLLAEYPEDGSVLVDDSVFLTLLNGEFSGRSIKSPYHVEKDKRNIHGVSKKMGKGGEKNQNPIKRKLPTVKKKKGKEDEDIDDEDIL